MKTSKFVCSFSKNHGYSLYTVFQCSIVPNISSFLFLLLSSRNEPTVPGPDLGLENYQQSFHNHRISFVLLALMPLLSPYRLFDMPQALSSPGDMTVATDSSSLRETTPPKSIFVMESELMV